MQPLYGFGGKDPARFARAAGHQDLLYVHDPELSFEQVQRLNLACFVTIVLYLDCNRAYLEGNSSKCLHAISLAAVASPALCEVSDLQNANFSAC